MPTVTLISSDEVTFEIDMEIAKCSTTIKTMLEVSQLEDDENVLVPLPNVTSKILEKIITWATYHKDNPEAYITAPQSSWDADFLNVDHKTLFAFMSATHYMEVKGLLDAICITVKNMITDKTPEDIRQFFNIKNDMKRAYIKRKDFKGLM